jgi:hypothetical protein
MPSHRHISSYLGLVALLGLPLVLGAVLFWQLQHLEPRSMMRYSPPGACHRLVLTVQRNRIASPIAPPLFLIAILPPGESPMHGTATPAFRLQAMIPHR